MDEYIKDGLGILFVSVFVAVFAAETPLPNEIATFVFGYGCAVFLVGVERVSK